MNGSESLYERDIIYRPPTEAESILLEAAVGCTHARCTYCGGQGVGGFHMIPWETVEKNAKILAARPENREKRSLFLLGGNTFALKSEKLHRIFALVHEHMPQVARISMYARADDVLRKTREEMLALKDDGLGDLYIGVESGSDSVLRRCNKGETTADMVRAFELLDEAGIRYSLSSIIGLGGRDDCWEHAVQTAELYNRVHPKTIRVMTLTPWPGTPLRGEIDSGRFTELKPGEMLLEERLFLSRLEVRDCLFIGTHVSNNVPLVGMLPDDKEMLLDILDEAIVSHDLEEVKRRTFEHM